MFVCVCVCVDEGNVVWLDKIGAMRALLKLSQDAKEAEKDHLCGEQLSRVEHEGLTFFFYFILYFVFETCNVGILSTVSVLFSIWPRI